MPCDYSKPCESNEQEAAISHGRAHCGSYLLQLHLAELLIIKLENWVKLYHHIVVPPSCLVDVYCATPTVIVEPEWQEILVALTFLRNI